METLTLMSTTTTKKTCSAQGAVPMLGLTLASAMVLGGCVSAGGGIGPNALLVPVTQKGVELVGYGAGAAMNSVMGKAEEPEKPLSGDAILTKAGESCVKENLSDADCARLKASAEKMTALAMNVQNLEAIAKESRRQQQAEAMKPQNIIMERIGLMY